MADYLPEGAGAIFGTCDCGRDVGSRDKEIRRLGLKLDRPGTLIGKVLKLLRKASVRLWSCSLCKGLLSKEEVMKYALLNKVKARVSVLTRMVRSPARRLGLIVGVLIGSALLGAVVRAYNNRTPSPINLTKPLTSAWLPQGTGGLQVAALHAKLSFQPEADKLRRRLGQRFLATGRERSTMVGMLTIGTERTLITIVRTHDDKGESVEAALGGRAASLTWSATEGPRSGANAANMDERSLIERLALDSPDQFVLAQLRGASYFTVARGATPPRASATDDYTGPVWDLIRIGEPEKTSSIRPQSLWRLYHINSLTGLLDKVVSQEEGKVIEATFSGWANQGGDWVPSRITWTTGTETLMELVLTNAAFGPRQ